MTARCFWLPVRGLVLQRHSTRPSSGAVFVLEELVRRFDTRVTIATLGASAGAIAVTHVLVGDAPDFHVPTIAISRLFWHGGRPPWPRRGRRIFWESSTTATLLATLAAMEQLHRWPVELRAALVGAVVALLAWFAPGVVGGGDAITQRTLSGTESLPCCRWFFSFASDLGRCRMQREHPADCSRPSWY